MNIDIKPMDEGAQAKFDVDKLLAEGWQYWDLPKMPKKYYDYILTSMGAGEVYNLTVARYDLEDGEWWRGQIIYSPQAKLNMIEYRKNNPLPE